MKTTFKLILIVLSLLLLASVAVAQGPDDNRSPFSGPDPNRPVGLTVSTDAVADGYILVVVLQSQEVVLLANDGSVVKVWDSEYYPSNSAYFLANGDLLRTASLPDYPFATGGQWGFTNGRLEQYNLAGELVWSFDYMTEDIIGHHDIEPMPNGHVLMLAYERFTAEESLAAGLDPALLTEENEIWSEVILEIDPDTNTIVWEWHVWDHLVQEYDSTRDNYGVVAEHPGRINLNYRDPSLPVAADWLHANAVAYNAELDQIMLTLRTYSELWVIDHQISSEEARGEAGDLLYRWGNPAAYDAGTEDDQYLYFPHTAHWIPDGYPGAGNILVFSNGGSDRPYSSIVEITPPLSESGAYVFEPGEAAGPAEPAWEYIADPPEDFYSPFISGAQRQVNGNTLITEGLSGRLFEVTPGGELVWEYYVPPATWVFRAERYDLAAFEALDLSQTFEFPSGVVWGADCQDGTQPRLYEYLPQEASSMELFIETYGDQAQQNWEIESCEEHGGLAE